MKTVLVTGGTVFVSRYIAEYYCAAGYDVYVLNRNTREQSQGVKLIEADRHHLGERVYFDQLKRRLSGIFPTAFQGRCCVGS